MKSTAKRFSVGCFHSLDLSEYRRIKFDYSNFVQSANSKRVNRNVERRNEWCLACIYLLLYA